MKARWTSRQIQILNIALDMIREEGLSGLTMRKLAERMGFSEPAIYRHFQSKQDLVLAIIKHLQIDLVEPMHTIASQRQRSAVERIGDLVRHHLDLIAKQNALPILLFAEASISSDKRLGVAMGKIFRSYEELLIGLLLQGQQTKEVDGDLHPGDTALAIIGASAACALRMRLLSKKSNKAQRARMVNSVTSLLSSTQGVA